MLLNLNGGLTFHQDEICNYKIRICRTFYIDSSDIQILRTYPWNLAPTGPISRIREASASPSMSGGGWISFSFFTSLHVTRVGMQALPGGTMMRTPEWRQPRIAPPRASTMKLTRKLAGEEQLKLVSGYITVQNGTLYVQINQASALVFKLYLS